MKQDIEFCKEMGVNGVVFGILREDGCVDEKRCKALVDLAKPLSSTFHRAFDMVNEPFYTLDAIIACEFERILTSGLEVNALKGAHLLAKLIEKAKDKIIIMPGGGVREDNVVELLKSTGAKEIHTSAKTIIKSKMEYRNHKITMNIDSDFDEYGIHSVDGKVIAAMKEAIRQFTKKQLTINN
jgi:copper homeostasis protein